MISHLLHLMHELGWKVRRISYPLSGICRPRKAILLSDCFLISATIYLRTPVPILARL